MSTEHVECMRDLLQRAALAWRRGAMHFHGEDEPRDMRPHERDPDAEPQEVDDRDVTLALAALAGEVAGGDGATYAAEFLWNLGVEKLNAMALHFYVTDPTFRAAFAADFEASVRTKLRSA